jgi:cyanate permease
VLTLGLFGGPLIVGWITDLTGNYTVGFEVCALIAVGGAVASFVCVAPEPAKAAVLAQTRPSTA